MEQIDARFKKFCTILNEINDYSNTIFSEQDSRIKIIDRILIEVLGWPFENIMTEPKAGKGYIDYALKIGNSYRFVLEAKRDGKNFEFDKNYSARAFKLNGPVFKSDYAKDGIDQAIYYCAYKGAELACLSNGREWVIFRGNRLGDGKEMMEGYGFIFSSLDSIKDNFKLFYDLLSFEDVSNFKYRAMFTEVEGQIVRTKLFRQSLFTSDQIRLMSKTDYGSDFEKVMNLLFKRLSGQEDPEFIKKCFVHTEESEVAKGKLEKISKDLIESVRKIKSKEGEELTKLISQVKETQKQAFVIIVGGKGSGKSTFIDIFFQDVLSNDLKDDCILVKIDLKQSEGNENTVLDWLNIKLLEEAEKTVFNGAPSASEIQGMFYDEYVRRRKAFEELYNSNKSQFKIEFANHIEEIRTKNPAEYIKRIIRSITTSRKKVPCIVIDNTDHFSIEFQEKVVQYAMSIYEQEICLIIMPITDRTSWQMSKQGALQSFEDIEILYLPTPPPKKIIEKRITFLQEKIEEEKTKGTEYIFGSSIKLKIEDLKGFVYYLQSVFLKNFKVATWIGNLGNLDIRRCLKISRNLIASPHLDLTDLIKVYVGNPKDTRLIKDHKVLNGLIKDKYTLFSGEQHEFVKNIYSLTDEIDSSPLLCLRILQLLIDNQDKNESLKSYLKITQILSYFSGMGYDNQVVLRYLDLMLKSGMSNSYDPTIIDIENAKSIEISPNGKQHYYWGLYDDNYLQAMLDVCPIRDENSFKEIKELRFSSSLWSLKSIEFVKYLITQDKLFTSIPDHESYDGQNKIYDILESRIGKLELIN